MSPTKWTNWWPLALIAVSFGRAGAGEQIGDILKTWPSPDGNAKVVWERIGYSDDPDDQYALTLNWHGSKPVRLGTFGRDADVTWSTDSKTIAFTDYLGSNVADCYIIDPKMPTARIDVWDLIPNLPNLADAHVDVICGDWVSKGAVNVQVTGQFDTPGGKEFDDRYTYDLSAKRLTPVSKR